MLTWLRDWLWPSSGAAFGSAGERLVARHLQQQGWRVLARGHRNRLGEIDLICLDGDSVVFVEVKARRGTEHGQPVDAVDREKQRRITQAALAYLKRRRWLDRRARFDVVAVVWPEGTSQPQITHFRNAFEPIGRGQLYS